MGGNISLQCVEKSIEVVGKDISERPDTIDLGIILSNILSYLLKLYFINQNRDT